MKKIFLIAALTSLFAFEYNSNKKEFKKLKKNFSYVPSGQGVIANDTFSVQGFYISKTEVTNEEYQLFLQDLKANNKMKEYKICLPDSSEWGKLSMGGSSAYKDYYFSHPAYKKFPVVNVSFEAANLYCKWFTEKINLGSKSKYNDFRLPTKEEFIRACRGDKHVQMYAWEGNSVRNKDSMIMCNHLHISKEKVAGSLTDDVDIIAPSKSYWPNQFGIYNLNGNVAEMTSLNMISMGGSWKNTESEVQNESVSKYKNGNPTLGFRMVSTKL
jgi:sulfatase modifying factor 1